LTIVVAFVFVVVVVVVVEGVVVVDDGTGFSTSTALFDLGSTIVNGFLSRLALSKHQFGLGKQSKSKQNTSCYRLR